MMEPTPQVEAHQPSQEELSHGLPEGYPPIREHLHEADVTPLPAGMQAILYSQKFNGKSEMPVVPIREPHWARADAPAPEAKN